MIWDLSYLVLIGSFAEVRWALTEGAALFEFHPKPWKDSAEIPGSLNYDWLNFLFMIGFSKKMITRTGLWPWLGHLPLHCHQHLWNHRVEGQDSLGLVWHFRNINVIIGVLILSWYKLEPRCFVLYTLLCFYIPFDLNRYRVKGIRILSSCGIEAFSPTTINTGKGTEFEGAIVALSAAKSHWTCRRFSWLQGLVHWNSWDLEISSEVGLPVRKSFDGSSRSCKICIQGSTSWSPGQIRRWHCQKPSSDKQRPIWNPSGNPPEILRKSFRIPSGSFWEPGLASPTLELELRHQTSRTSSPHFWFSSSLSTSKVFRQDKEQGRVKGGCRWGY